MTHFAGLVIGNKVEEQLAPYDEHLQGPRRREEDDRYFTQGQELIDWLADCEKRHAEWVANPPVATGNFLSDSQNREPFKPREDWRSLTMDELMRWYHEDEDFEWDAEQNKYVQYTTYSKIAKWDWYVIGGRFAGHFKLKSDADYDPGKFEGHALPYGAEREWDKSTITAIRTNARVAQCLKGQVDFAGMEAEAAAKALDYIYEYRRLTEGTPPAKSWTQCQKDFNVGNYYDDTYSKENNEAARAFFEAQPRAQTLKGSRTFVPWFEYPGRDPIEEIDGLGAQGYVQWFKERCWSTYAVIKWGEWMSKELTQPNGRFGGTMDEHEWNHFLREMVLELPDDTMLTCVDFHI